MRITQIIGTNMDLTEAIKQHVTDKLMSLEKICADLEPCDFSVDVGKTTAGQQKGKIFRAEYNLSVPGAMLRVESVEEDLYFAIDTGAHDLKRRLAEYKDKRR